MPEENGAKRLNTLDTVFDEYIGTFGKFQKLLICYILVVVGPLIGFNLSTQLLILLVPPHLCEESVIGSPVNFTNSTAAGFNATDTPVMPGCELIFHLDQTGLNTSYTIKCPEGQKYDHGIVYPTLVSENDWVCHDKWKSILPHVVFRAGSVFGVLIIGILADKYGRVPTSMFCFSLAGVAGFATIFAGKNFIFFLVCRAFVGFVSFKGTIPMILVTEFVGPKERSYVSTGLLFSVGLTNITLPWFAFLIRDWRLLAGLTSGAMFLVPVLSLFTPESVRWLVTRGDAGAEKARKVVQKIADINGAFVPAFILNDIGCQKDSSKESLWNIFQYKRFLKMFSLTTIIWVIIAMISWGGNLYVAILTDHPFVMISINSGLDVVATAASQWFADRFGRKPTVIFSSILTFVFYSITAFIPGDMNALFLSILFIARFGVTVTYNVKYLYGVELFPTAIRSRGLALRLSVGCIGGLVSPYILTIQWMGRSTPLVIYGILSCVAGIVMFFLPETLGKSLPETIEDANNFGLLDDEDKLKSDLNSSPFDAKRFGSIVPPKAIESDDSAIPAHINYGFRYVDERY